MTKACVATPDATRSTKRRRSDQLAGIRAMASGGAEAASAQLQEELGKDARRKLMAQPQFARPISAEEGLPWYKIRQGRRYK